MAIAFVGIGSNIESERNIRRAAGELRRLFPNIVFSSIYRTAPQEVEDQPDFLNAVAKIETDEPPEFMLTKLQSIEELLEKNPPYKSGPRTIDLDLLLYDNAILPNSQDRIEQPHMLPCTSTRIRLPHTKMHGRRFVLEPLCEVVDPGKKHPVLGETWQNLLQKSKHQRCTLTQISL
jgi:2-amino-4-hydroxy-6-hydroxymethyldihydropteridine diphosphokinase